MSANNGDMPAMPSTTWDNDFDKVVVQTDGLTKREHFAGLAMQGLLAGDTEDNLTANGIIRDSIYLADALLEELGK